MLNAKSLIFSVKGEVVGFDLGQLRTIEILDETTVSFSYSVGGEVPHCEVDPCRCEHDRRFPSRSEDFGVGPRCYSSGVGQRSRLRNSRDALKNSGKPSTSGGAVQKEMKVTGTVRRGLEDMLDAT